MKKKKIISFLIFIVLIIVCFILYARYIGTTGVKVIETPVVDNDIPTSFEGFKIVEFADIHYGNTTSLKDIKLLVNKINQLKPDLIIFAGDLFDNSIKISENDVNSLKEELSKIDDTVNKYAVKGDQDYSNLTDFETIFKYANFTILDNSNELVYYKNTVPIKIVGTTSILKSKIDYNSAFTTLGDENDYFTILIAHEPTIVNEIKDYKVNVLFTSHSLGGLINIPFVGGLIHLKGTDNYTKGLYNVGNVKMYVNSGIGTQDYKFRFNNRPSIDLFRLYNN